jgi:hypothetical protein
LPNGANIASAASVSWTGPARLNASSREQGDSRRQHRSENDQHRPLRGNCDTRDGFHRVVKDYQPGALEDDCLGVGAQELRHAKIGLVKKKAPWTVRGPPSGTWGVAATPVTTHVYDGLASNRPRNPVLLCCRWIPGLRCSPLSRQFFSSF